MILVEGDTAYDTDFAMFYTLYHIFKQENIQFICVLKSVDKWLLGTISEYSQ